MPLLQEIAATSICQFADTIDAATDVSADDIDEAARDVYETMSN